MHADQSLQCKWDWRDGKYGVDKEMESGWVKTLGWPSVAGSHIRLQSSCICALVVLMCCLLGVQVLFSVWFSLMILLTSEHVPVIILLVVSRSASAITLIWLQYHNIPVVLCTSTMTGEMTKILLKVPSENFQLEQRFTGWYSEFVQWYYKPSALPAATHTLRQRRGFYFFYTFFAIY